MENESLLSYVNRVRSQLRRAVARYSGGLAFERGHGSNPDNIYKNWTGGRIVLDSLIGFSVGRNRNCTILRSFRSDWRSMYVDECRILLLICQAPKQHSDA